MSESKVKGTVEIRNSFFSNRSLGLSIMATPVIGPSLTGVGRHWQTQLVLAVSFLKQLNRPIRLEDLAITSGIEALLHNYELLEALKNHERVRYDPRTELFQYKASCFSLSPLSLSLRSYFPFFSTLLPYNHSHSYSYYRILSSFVA